MTTVPKRASTASATVDGDESDGEEDGNERAVEIFTRHEEFSSAQGRGEKVVGRVRVHVER